MSSAACATAPFS